MAGPDTKMSDGGMENTEISLEAVVNGYLAMRQGSISQPIGCISVPFCFTLHSLRRRREAEAMNHGSFDCVEAKSPGSGSVGFQ